MRGKYLYAIIWINIISGLKTFILNQYQIYLRKHYNIDADILSSSLKTGKML